MSESIKQTMPDHTDITGRFTGRKMLNAMLAGTLALGMVPGVAMAAPADEVESGDIMLLAATGADAFSTGKVTLVKGDYATDFEDAVAGAPSSLNLTSDGNQAIMVAATQVTTADQKTVDLTSPGEGVTYTQEVYAADADGMPTGDPIKSLINSGSYCLVITVDGGEYDGGRCVMNFEVKSPGFATGGLYEINPASDSDVSDTTFTFTGNALNIGFQVGSTPLVEGVDYTVTYAKSTGEAVTEIVNAGTYRAEITGLGKYAGEHLSIAQFTVSPFDLTGASVGVNDTVGTLPVHPGKVTSNDGETQLDANLVKLQLASSNSVWNDNKQYTLDVLPMDGTDGNVTGTCTATVYKVAELVNVKYGREAMPETYEVNNGDAIPDYFDTDLITVYAGEKKLTKGTNYSVSILDEAGDDVSAAFNAHTPGVYRVVVAVTDQNGNGGLYGGADECVVTIKAGTVDTSTTAWVRYDDKVVTDMNVNYQPGGTSIDLSKLTVGLTDQDGDAVSASDYKAVVVDAEGNEYQIGSSSKDVLTEPGEYTLVITSDKYVVENSEAMSININKMNLADVNMDSIIKSFRGFDYVESVATSDGGKTYSDVVYEADTLPLVYNTGFDEDADGEDDFVALPTTDEFTVTLEQYVEKSSEWVEVDETDGDGKYRVVIALADEDLAGNYEFADAETNSTTIEFTMLDQRKCFYDDVNPSEWYFENIAIASGLDWIHGYGGTRLFGPTDSITRGQVAIVLFNMAGGDSSMSDNQYDENYGWQSFEDVDGKMYYAEAIAWAKAAGVVHGVGDTGLFEPERSVTREEFATMIANYAEKIGVDVTPENIDGTLAAYPDGNTTSEWAESVVAWAVEQGIMGKNTTLNPTDDISRAEAVTMMVRFGADNDLV